MIFMMFGMLWSFLSVCVALNRHLKTQMHRGVSRGTISALSKEVGLAGSAVSNFLGDFQSNRGKLS